MLKKIIASSKGMWYVLNEGQAFCGCRILGGVWSQADWGPEQPHEVCGSPALVRAWNWMDFKVFSNLSLSVTPFHSMTLFCFLKSDIVLSLRYITSFLNPEPQVIIN